MYGDYEMSFKPSFFDRVGKPNPLCSQCNRLPLVSPVEQRNKLCYVCISWRNYHLRKWKEAEGGPNTYMIEE